jgi:hypothetical protein
MIRKLLPVVLVLVMNAALVEAAREPQYSADMVTRVNGQTMSGKVYVDGNKMRYEMPQGVTITRLDRQISYMLMTTEKMYMEQPIDPSAATKAGMTTQGELQRILVGKEMIGERMADKFKITYADVNGNRTIYQWVDAQGLPAKVESEDGSWSVEYRNVKPGRPPENLFEVPADYHKFTMPVFAGINGAITSEGRPMDAQELLQDARQQAEDAEADNLEES